MSQKLGDYDNWAWLYNRTLGPEYCAEKRSFLERTLIPGTPPGGRILDLCCGTGQMILPLLGNGYDVTGLDYSADMLRFARENAPDAKFVRGDARNFVFDEPFDAVLCTSASLNHMESLHDLRRVFGCVHGAVREGGVFVFDLNHPAQLKRYWRGQPAEGEIEADYAWLITPRYDAERGEGSFAVDIYRRPPGAQVSPLKDLLSKILSHRLLRRRRLERLGRFAAFRPDWEHRSTTYPIYGHDLVAVEALLRSTGFDVSIETIESGGLVDEKHAAHFVCRKRTGEKQWQQTQAPINARVGSAS